MAFPANSAVAVCPCAPAHLLISPEEHVLSCLAQVIKGQQPGRESFRKPLPAALHLCPPCSLSAGHTNVAPGPAETKVTLPGKAPARFPPALAAESCQAPA